MPGLADSWRRVLAQQSLTTGGQGVTPQQAAALQYGDIMGNYEMAADREKQGLDRQRIDNQKAYQEGSLELGKQGLGLQQQQFGLQAQQFQNQMQLARERLAEQQREFGGPTAAAGGTTWLTQQQINNAKQQADVRYSLMQDQIAAQNQARTIGGAIAAPVGAAMLYGLGKQSGVNDFLGGVAKDFGIGKS